jgi:hypothetical protein
MAAKVQVKIFWVAMMCSVAVGYQCFGGPCCLHYHEYGDNMDLQNVGILPQHYMTSQSRQCQLGMFF